MPMTSSFSPNEPFDRVFLLKSIDERRTKAGKPYLAITLGTQEGAWEARVWDMALSSLPGLLEGDPVHAKGTVQLYQDKTQLIVDTISKTKGYVDPRSIYPAAAASEDQLRTDFDDLVSAIGSPMLRNLMSAMVQDQAILEAFFVSPAAITMHHARIGGLAEHSINVCRLAHGVTPAAPWLDQDLLTVGALLHDIGKILEYEVAGDFRYTIEGKFLGHIIQGHSLVERWISQIPDFPQRLALDVLHIILSHHGQLEYGSPKTPATAEALVIHFADDLDAKLDMIRTAGEDPGTEEAFVRGLRRSFQYRNERQEKGKRGKGEKGKDSTASLTHPSTGSGQAEQLDAETRGRGDAEEKISEGESGRTGEGEKELETGKRGTGETEKEPTNSQNHGTTGKKEGQEELF